ncbi:MAG: hypothetical protein GXY55_17185 [Phycisphaerae bacterium]|nr:hypothetical protein [Phycisphaerae bacterium]
MHVPMMGEILSEMGLLTSQQVEDILEHQRRSRQKFGQIAVHQGLVTPEQVWEAWARQVSYRRQFIDLDVMGVDTEAVRRVGVSTARALEVVPLRLWGDNLVVACSPEFRSGALSDLAERTGCQIHACIALPESIRYHLNQLDNVLESAEKETTLVPMCG